MILCLAERLREVQPRPGAGALAVHCGRGSSAVLMVALSVSAEVHRLEYIRHRRIPAPSPGSETCDRGRMSPDGC